MKTSDKLLLGTFVTAMALMGGAQLALYARYRKGDILTAKAIYRQNHVRTALPAPGYLRIKGVYETHFIPADTFAIEYEKGGIRRGDFIYAVGPDRVMKKDGEELVAQPRYYRSGDTLVIEGYDPEVQVGTVTTSVRSLNVYGLAGGTIEMEGGNSYLEGKHGGEGGDYRILLKRNILYLGQSATEPDAADTEKIGHIRMLSVNVTDGSQFEFGRWVQIRDLSLDLDPTSSLTEQQGWDVGQIHLRADSLSKLNMSGRLMKKLLEGQGAPAQAEVR
jgi:hypothetical protein